MAHKDILEGTYELAAAPEENGFFLRTVTCESCGRSASVGVRLRGHAGEAIGMVECACGTTRWVRSTAGTWTKRRSGVVRETPRRPQWVTAR